MDPDIPGDLPPPPPVAETEDNVPGNELQEQASSGAIAALLAQQGEQEAPKPVLKAQLFSVPDDLPPAPDVGSAAPSDAVVTPQAPVPPPPTPVPPQEGGKARMSTLRNAFWDVVDDVVELPPEKERPLPPSIALPTTPAPAPVPVARSSSSSLSYVNMSSSAPAARSSTPVLGRRKGQSSAAASSSSKKGASLKGNKGSSTPKGRRRSSLLAAKKRAVTDRGPSRSSAREPSFPGLPLHRVEECPACLATHNVQAFLRCSSCKRDTCSSCTIIRAIDGRQRLACKSCGAKAQREAALKRKAVPIEARGPQGVVALPLAQLAAAEGRPDQLPLLFEWLLSHMRDAGAYTAEGIFRLSVSGASLAEAIAELSACTPPDYHLPVTLDAHGYGGVFKQWLRDLPEPIIVDYATAIPPTDVKEELDVLDAQIFVLDHYRRVLDSLPKSNAATLLALCHFLKDFAQDHVVAKTKMGIDNLCTVFSQTLMRNPSLDPFSLLKNQPREHRFLLNLLRLLDEVDPKETE